MPVIEIRELTKRFGPVSAVEQLSFDVGAGSIVGFLGPNGAGKTTTLRMLLGLVEPTSGSSTICGRPYRKLRNPLRHVGAVLEASDIHPGRRARDHLLIQAMTGQVPRGRVDEVLELVGLASAAGRRVGEFSLGMRQRLGLAGALVCEPDVLVLDEPANGLDPEGVRWLRELLRGLAAQGRTVLLSSHILAEVAQTADSVVILDKGRLAVQSDLGDLTRQASLVRIRTPQPEELAHVLSPLGASVKVIGPDRLEISGASVEQIGVLAAERNIPIFEADSKTVGLEDVFLELTGQEHR